MTEAYGAQTGTVDELLGLLPVHVRSRDEAGGGALRALLEAVAGELDVLQGDIDELYASWFIETCPEWVVPYIGDLVGVTDLPPDLGAGQGRAAGSGAAVSRRAVVANTVAYRRRKGTTAVIEQVAGDVTGWPARAVEYFRLLATSTHINHLHLERSATVSIRNADALDRLPASVSRGALDPFAHTAEIRRIAPGRGRYGIGNIGVFLFPTQVYRSGWASARAPEAGSFAWSADPLGRRAPLFAVPATELTIERLAQEEDLPVPLRPRRLMSLLQAARTDESTSGATGSGSPVTLGQAVAELPIALRIADDDLTLAAERVRVCGLEDLAESTPGTALEGWQVTVDTVTGLLRTYLDGEPANPDALQVDYSYGGVADVGAGTYDRSEVHAAALEGDPYTGDPARGGPGAMDQTEVLTGDLDPPLATALAAAEQAWAALSGSPAGATYVISIGDSGSYPGDLAVTLPEATRLVIVAATWPERVFAGGEVLTPPFGVYAPVGLRPHVAGTLTVTGGPGSSLVLDGVVLEGDLVIAPGELGSLTVSQSTLTGAVRVQGNESRPNRDLDVLLLRSIAARVDLALTVPALTVRDSVLDASRGPAPGTDPTDADPAVRGAGVHLSVEGSTVRGAIRVRTLDATSSVLDGPADTENRQTGCVRYCYVGPGSRVPRRFRCVPATDGEPGPRPVFVSDEPGSPWYLELAASCPEVIGAGGESGAEMGVHHHLRRPPRVQAAQRLLAPYVPVGLEFGLLSGPGELG